MEIKNCIFISPCDLSKFDELYKKYKFKENCYNIEGHYFKIRQLKNDRYLEIDRLYYPYTTKTTHILFGCYKSDDDIKQKLKSDNIRFHTITLYITKCDDQYFYYRSLKRLSYRNRFDCWLITERKHMNFIKKEISNYCYLFPNNRCILHLYGSSEIIETGERFTVNFAIRILKEKNIQFKIYNDYNNEYPNEEKFEEGKRLSVIQLITDINLGNQV